MIKLIVSDMDGTLLTELTYISKENSQAIKKAKEQGIKFIVATGRNYQEAKDPLSKAQIESDIIIANGAQTVNFQGDVLDFVYLSKETSLNILKTFLKEGIYLEIATDKGIFSPSMEWRVEVMAEDIVKHKNIDLSEAKIQIRNHLKHFQAHYTDDLEKIIIKDDINIMKFFAVSSNMPENFQNLQDIFYQNNKNIVISSSGYNNMEINHIEAQKGVALEKYAKKLEIDPYDIIVFGDSFNDLSMFKFAGTAVAMGQAHTEVKKHATHTTLSNRESGVAYIIEQILNGEFK